MSNDNLRGIGWSCSLRFSDSVRKGRGRNAAFDDRVEVAVAQETWRIRNMEQTVTGTSAADP
jgi:hypothetical protein